jgi:hypothetical protein
MPTTSRNVQHSCIFVAWFLVEQQQRQFQLCASDPAVSLVFWRTQCPLNHPTRKSLVVLSQVIGVDAHCTCSP